MPTWVDLDDTTDWIPDALLELEGRTLELRKCFAGSSAPSSPVEGQLWLDTTSSPHKLYVYAKIDGGSAAWQPLGPISRLPASINADPSTSDARTDPYEFKALRVENRNALPTAGSGNAGMLVYRTTDGELWISDQPIAGAWKGLLSAKASGSYDAVDISLHGDVGNDATNPPTQAREGVVEGWLFDATNEKRTIALVVPKNWRGSSDLKLRLHQVLDGDETAGDDIEWTGEVRTVVAAAGGVTGTATALADASTDIGSDTEGIAAGGYHRTDLVIDHDDATNPVAASCLLLVTVWRKTVGGAGKAGGVILFRAELLYEQGPRHERA